jgi:hypothetical protein
LLLQLSSLRYNISSVLLAFVPPPWPQVVVFNCVSFRFNIGFQVMFAMFAINCMSSHVSFAFTVILLPALPLVVFICSSRPVSLFLCVLSLLQYTNSFDTSAPAWPGAMLDF